MTCPILRCGFGMIPDARATEVGSARCGRRGDTPHTTSLPVAANNGDRYTARVKQLTWETIFSESHFANAHLEVVTDRVRTPSRSEPRTWTIVHRKPAVVIAPMTRDGKIVLIRQERIPIREAIWETPSGQIDAVAGVADSGNQRETIEQVALRELREEAGYELAKDGELIPLGYYFSSSGFTDERGYFFLARPVVPRADYVRDESESILDCHPFTISEIRRMIAENEIRDGNTLGACARLAARGFISLESR
jgi:ADP-ribose pyrophosphatase